MDDAGGCFNAAGFCDYFSDLPLLHSYQVRDWLSFLVLHAEIRDSAFNSTAHYSFILLQKTAVEEGEELGIHVVFTDLRNIVFVPLNFLHKRSLTNLTFGKLADFARESLAVIQMEIEFNRTVGVFCD